MPSSERPFADQFMRNLIARNPGEPEFHQSVQRFVESIIPVIERRPRYLDHCILERIVEPERVILFRVSWSDDRGEIQVNRGFRVEFNSALGPCKGGLRFHSTVNLGVFKSLGFEQVFCNSLTTLPLGGGMAGSDFDPKGRSDDEVMRFCQSFMTEFCSHMGLESDVPTAEIGVGGREIGYLFGQYKRLRRSFEGVSTGKGVKWGGSLIRPEATGYGAVYFAEEMLKTRDDGFQGKRVAISGTSDVAQSAAKKCLALGARIVAFSGRSGYVVIDGGATGEMWEEMMEHRNVRRNRVSELASSFPGMTYHEGPGLWSVPCDVALPCATRNELDSDDAEALLDHGCTCVSEGGKTSTTATAVDVFRAGNLLFGPGKAAGAGGAAIAGLEMGQNRMQIAWTDEEVDERLHCLMIRIHQACATAAAEHGAPGNYSAGADIAGFVRVADSMIDQGIV